LEVEEKFARKCLKCGTESTNDVQECEECKFRLLRKPDIKEKKVLEELLKSCNTNRQTLLDFLRQIERDFETFDDAFVLFHYDYGFDALGEMVKKDLKEILQLDPVWIKFVQDRAFNFGYNSSGERIYVCLQHRTFEQKSDRCNICNLKTYPAWFNYTGYGQKSYYYADFEVHHASKYMPSLARGDPPIRALVLKLKSLLGQDMFIWQTYSLQRPPRGIFVFATPNPDGMAEAISAAREEHRKMPLEPLMLTIQNEGVKQAAEYINFMPSNEEMQFVEMRNEFRRICLASYGVTPVFSGDVQSAGGLSNESLMPDVPVVIKQKGWLDIVPIASLHTTGDHKLCNRGLEDKEVLTRSGWSLIKNVFRHKVKERDIYEVNTTTGFTSITGDHSIFREDKSELYGKDVKEKDKIELREPEPDVQLETITPSFAYMLGAFAADGTSTDKHAGVRVCIDDANKETLQKAKEGAEAFFADKFHLRETAKMNEQLYRLDMSKQKVYDWINEYCYSSYRENNFGKDGIETIRLKKVPPQILNGTKEVKEAYLKGYMTGDGHIDERGRETFSSISKPLAAGLQYLFNVLGHKTKVEWKENNGNMILRIRIVKTDFKTKENEVTKILKTTYSGSVYDIETEDHTFVGGLGYIVHHNSRQLQILDDTVEFGQNTLNNKILNIISECADVSDYRIIVAPAIEKDKLEEVTLKKANAEYALIMRGLGYKAVLKADGTEFDFEENPLLSLSQANTPFGQSNQQSSGFGSADEQATSGQSEQKIPLGKAPPPKGAKVMTGPKGGKYYTPKPADEEASDKQNKLDLTKEIKKKQNSFETDIKKLFEKAKQELKITGTPTRQQAREIAKHIRKYMDVHHLPLIEKELKSIILKEIDTLEKEFNKNILVGKTDNLITTAINDKRMNEAIENFNDDLYERLSDTISNKDITLDNLVKELNTSMTERESKLINIARTESGKVANQVRIAAYEEVKKPDDKYTWDVISDHRTTDTCKRISNRTKDGVTLEELIKTIQEESIKEFPDWSVDNNQPLAHYMCRSLVKLLRR